MSASFQPDPVPTPKPRSTGKVVLIVLTVIMLLCALACCGVAAVFWYGWSAAEQAVANDLRPQIDGNPVIEEHIGTIQTLTVDSMESFNEMQKNPGTPTFVLPVEGSKGKGKIIVSMSQQQGDKIASAKLVLADGQVHELTLNDSPSATDDFTVDEGEMLDTETPTDPQSETDPAAQ